MLRWWSWVQWAWHQVCHPEKRRSGCAGASNTVYLLHAEHTPSVAHVFWFVRVNCVLLVTLCPPACNAVFYVRCRTAMVSSGVCGCVSVCMCMCIRGRWHCECEFGTLPKFNQHISVHLVETESLSLPLHSPFSVPVCLHVQELVYLARQTPRLKFDDIASHLGRTSASCK